MQQMFGNARQRTRSPLSRTDDAAVNCAVGQYIGKFMVRSIRFARRLFRDAAGHVRRLTGIVSRALAIRTTPLGSRTPSSSATGETTRRDQTARDKIAQEHGGDRRGWRPRRHDRECRQRAHQALEARQRREAAQGHADFIDLELVADLEGQRVRLSANAAVAMTLEEEQSGKSV
jgi:hypothetical protein